MQPHVKMVVNCNRDCTCMVGCGLIGQADCDSKGGHAMCYVVAGSGWSVAGKTRQCS